MWEYEKTLESWCGRRELSLKQRFFIWILLFFSTIRRSILAAEEDEAENWKLGYIWWRRWRRWRGLMGSVLCLFTEMAEAKEGDYIPLWKSGNRGGETKSFWGCQQGYVSTQPLEGSEINFSGNGKSNLRQLLLK